MKNFNVLTIYYLKKNLIIFTNKNRKYKMEIKCIRNGKRLRVLKLGNREWRGESKGCRVRIKRS